MLKCEVCDAEIKSGKWPQIRAHNAGWYFMKDGSVFCPLHRPHFAPLIVTEEDIK